MSGTSSVQLSCNSLLLSFYSSALHQLKDGIEKIVAFLHCLFRDLHHSHSTILFVLSDHIIYLTTQIHTPALSHHPHLTPPSDLISPYLPSGAPRRGQVAPADCVGRVSALYSAAGGGRSTPAEGASGRAARDLLASDLSESLRVDLPSRGPARTVQTGECREQLMRVLTYCEV